MTFEKSCAFSVSYFQMFEGVDFLEALGEFMAFLV